MTTGRLAVAAALALNVAAVLPAQADNCRLVKEQYREFLSDKDAAMKEGTRINARDRDKPLNRKMTPDHVYCLALRQVMDDTLILLIADDSCFPTAKDKQEFTEGVQKVGSAAASLSGFYCTQADLQAPLRHRGP